MLKISNLIYNPFVHMGKIANEIRFLRKNETIVNNCNIALGAQVKEKSNLTFSFAYDTIPTVKKSNVRRQKSHKVRRKEAEICYIRI